MKWINPYKNYYINKGYKFTNLRDTFWVEVNDLPPNSGKRVRVICDHCNTEFEVFYNKYNKYVKDNNKYYCKHCAQKLYSGKAIKAALLKKSISFQQWCYDNLSKEKADKIMQRWDYEKNNCSPDEVTYCSTGINCKGYWFKCLDNHEHKSELKNTSNFTSGHNGSMECKQCNSIAKTHPDLIKYFLNDNDTYKHSYGSGRKVLMKCPTCGYEKHMIILNLSRQGFSCSKCGDGVSYPEKFIFALLSQIKIEFISQYSKSNASWCSKYRYDFYLPEYNTIIEVMGIQHYEGWNYSGKSLLEIQENDKLKKELSLQNGIKNYIEIDARKSELEWMKNSILDSELSDMFDLSCIDWLQCEANAQSSWVRKVCDLWNNEIHSIKQIAYEMNLCKDTVTKYLKTGSKIGWCNYGSTLKKKIVCLNTSEIFDSIINIAECYNINTPNIQACINRSDRKSAGKHPVTGEPLRWMYYEDYIKLQEESA